MEEEEI
jgi:hypothetical protein